MTTGMHTGRLHVGFGNKGSEFGYFKTWLVREAQIRDRGYGTCGRYKGYVIERSGRGPRQPPFAAHPHIDIHANIYIRIYTHMHLSMSVYAHVHDIQMCSHIHISIYIMYTSPCHFVSSGAPGQLLPARSPAPPGPPGGHADHREARPGALLPVGDGHRAGGLRGLIALVPVSFKALF